VARWKKAMKALIVDARLANYYTLFKKHFMLKLEALA
jgi:hypothetical protein